MLWGSREILYWIWSGESRLSVTYGSRGVPRGTAHGFPTSAYSIPALSESRLRIRYDSRGCPRHYSRVPEMFCAAMHQVSICSQHSSSTALRIAMRIAASIGEQTIAFQQILQASMQVSRRHCKWDCCKHCKEHTVAFQQILQAGKQVSIEGSTVLGIANRIAASIATAI